MKPVPLAWATLILTIFRFDTKSSKDLNGFRDIYAFKESEEVGRDDVSDQDLHCLPMSHKKDARLILNSTYVHRVCNVYETGCRVY